MEELIFDLIMLLKEIIFSPETLNEARRKPQYFTRKRKLSFPHHLVFGLAHFNGSINYELMQYFEQAGVDMTMLKSSYSEARGHYDETPYKKMFEEVTKRINDYMDDRKIKKFGVLIVAIDGSLVPLPDMPVLLSDFGGVGRKAGSPTARMSLCFDSLNHIIYDAILAPLKVDERSLAVQHLENVKGFLDLKDITFVFDRGYASLWLVRLMEELDTHFIMRVKSNFSTEVRDAPMGSSLIELKNGCKVRAVKLTLGSGQEEWLITNLTKPEAEDFRNLYALRWPVEVYYYFIKHLIGLTDFNGYSENSVRQAFWISMTLANLLSAIGMAADEVIRAKHEKMGLKRECHCNRNMAVAALHVDLVGALLEDDEEKIRQRVKSIVNYSTFSPDPVRPELERERSLTRKVFYHHNRKRN